MPIIEVFTNVKSADTKDLSLKVANLSTQLLSKPIGYMMVNVGCIGNVGGSLNAPIVANLNDLVSKELNVSGTRIFVLVDELQGSNVALDGQIFG
ncbi:Tautomerase/MIF [Linderina pennispora]|uniref:Tautomerase/MIF n=1 Tax=Linderina pennispora TaxID=61395 RepID=A0A1Y1WM59_9FUNG|nr:Tautomerase/MIF [Linderina pennispora]ORX74639.1 Tautomerase/MIF [Linderina pennispora]